MELIKNFASLGIRVLSVTENNEDNPTGTLIRNVIGAFNQFENEVRGESSKNGMMQAVREGRWCWRSPIGYNSLREDSKDNKAIIVPNKESEYIAEAFKLAEKGMYGQVEIYKKLKKNGFKKITKGLLNRVLRNPLYCGLIKVDWFPDYIDAIHKPIISKETFFKV